MEYIFTSKRSTLARPAMKLGAAWLASAPLDVQEKFLSELTESELHALPWIWEFWAMQHQLPPPGLWKTWVAMGGRGAGKTRAGAEWVRGQVEGPRPQDWGRSRRVALVGETFDQARDVMVFGESGLLAVAPPDRRPDWQATRRRLVWPNGAEAQVFSASDPEGLRGPQFDCAWSDELAKWAKGDATWSMLQFALRLGRDPRQVVTTTLRDVSVFKKLLKRPSTVVTSAPTAANRANLAPSFLSEISDLYQGTSTGRQELDGLLVEGVEGAFWSAAMLEAAVVEKMPEVDRIVVAVDPPATSHSGSDECGIVVAGAMTSGAPGNWYAVVLEDATIAAASPRQWAETAVDALHRHQADRLVAEVNQGGDMVRDVLLQVDPALPYRAVRATRGKAVRAEPIAALYEQGRIHHLRGMEKLEEQMMQMTRTGFAGSRSPDRVDALVWALTDLILEPLRSSRGDPRIRTI